MPGQATTPQFWSRNVNVLCFSPRPVRSPAGSKTRAGNVTGSTPSAVFIDSSQSVPYNGRRQFEWDREKTRRNLLKHRVSFDETVTVFYDPLATTVDDLDHSISKRRCLTIGHSARGRLLVGAIRIEELR